MAKYWIVFLLASISFGSDVISIGLRTSFRYEALEKECSLPPLGDHFIFSAILEGNKITQAMLKKTMVDGYSEVLELLPEEIAEIEVQSINSHIWLKRWRVSGRILERLLYGGTDKGFDTCYPFHGIETIQPDFFVFEFKNTVAGANYSDSNEAHFTGNTKKGQAYEIELFLVQDRI